MAVVDMFLKIDGIEGESTDAKHKGELDILSFSWGESNAASAGGGGGGGAGKVSMQDFHFVARVSKASPKLFLHCADGAHIKQAVLTVRRTGRDQLEFLKWTFSDVVVSSYQEGGNELDVPSDQVSINFAKIEVSYWPQKPDGTLDAPVTAGWDLKANKPT